MTPGVSLNDNVLERKKNNFLACVYFDKNLAGVSFLDVSTGEFLVAQGNYEYIDKLLSGLEPKEVLVEKRKFKEFQEIFGSKYYTYPLDEWIFSEETSREKLTRQFETSSLKGFGIQSHAFGIVAAGAILQYLEITRHDKLNHITSISRIEEDNFVWLDRFTIRNLELFNSLNEGAKTLLEVVDKTISPMGSRMLKRWLALPLKQIKPINDRLNVVDYFIEHPEFKAEVASSLKLIGDLERLVSKVSVGRINPRELQQLKTALEEVQKLKQLCNDADEQQLKTIAEQLNPCTTIRERIAAQLIPDPPVQIQKGNVIAKGVSEELDDLRDALYSGKDYLVQLQQREIERTGITSLKVSFNNVFGYYIEVRNTHKDKVPSDWIRKQTLVSAERYITGELKEYEEKILGAEEKILALETSLYNDLVFAVIEFIQAIQLNASLIARLDCLYSFSVLGGQKKYCRPEINDSLVIDIRDGRHPVIEMQLPAGEEYVANDVFLDSEDKQIIIITGPNMSGKSAILRQTALIVLMAQIGCFVPAKSASIGIVDKIFTRVGASDNISLGESTFMVEMNEAASILNNLSPRSLILLDEIGRGTSTYDGISIAWAMAEYIHEFPHGKAKTLFATHYHELNEMEKSFSRIKNFHIAVKELENRVIFLRKFIPGGSEHSFGIHVAKMAGMPKSVVGRANTILKELEQSHQKQSLTKPVADLADHREGLQLSFFQLDDPVLKQIRDQIRDLDVDNLTPIEALNKLNEIKKISGL